MNEVLYEKALEDMMRDKDVLELEKYSQPGATSTLDHCLHVTRTAGKIAKQLNLKISEEELVRGSMLHDYICMILKMKMWGPTSMEQVMHRLHWIMPQRSMT